MNRSFNLNRKRAFTLIEVLVVVAIIALIVAILIPSLQKARAQTRRTLCLSNVHQLAVALYSYQASHKGVAPAWPDTLEYFANAEALWAIGPEGQGHPTRLGLLYPRYVGRNENVFYCPDAKDNYLHNKGDDRITKDGSWKWSNYGSDKGWAYGSYEYRPRYWWPNGQGPGLGQFIKINYDKQRQAVVADAFSGNWDAFGPYPFHSPIEDQPKTLYYNVGYTDGSAAQVRDFIRGTGTRREFWTRAGVAAQQLPQYYTASRANGVATHPVAPEYTPLKSANCEPLPIDRIKRSAILNDTDHIDRAWTFFERK